MCLPFACRQSLLLVLSFICFTTEPASAQSEKQLFSLEDIWIKGTFSVESVPLFNARKNGTSYTQIDDFGSYQEINEYDLRTGKSLGTVYSSQQSAFSDEIVRYEFSEDEQKLLLFGTAIPIYRHSKLEPVWVVDLQKKTTTALLNEPVLHATFNPQGTKVAYVKDNNLLLKDLTTGTTLPVTDDGKKNFIINGNCDWVYEEEFSFTRAFEWSPDGAYLAYYRFDESGVKEYSIPLYDEGSSYPRLYTYKYPKAGEANSVVNIQLYHVESGTNIAADLGSEKDQYIPRIKWIDKEHLCIYRLNRLQNHLELLQAQASTGATRKIYEEKSPYYVEINDNLNFLPGKQAFVMSSERSGFNHLYIWNWATQQLQALTTGNWEVDEMVGVDQKRGLVYFTAGLEDPKERKLYSVSLKPGAQPKCYTPKPGVYKVQPCTGFKYFLLSHSAVHQVPTFQLINHKGKIVRTLEDNLKLQESLDQYAWGKLNWMKIPNGDGQQLNAYAIYPVNFDREKKYPVLLYQYSGPGSQEVLNKFPLGNYFWHQYLAQRGYIVVCADGTGTGGRGVAFKNKTYLQLGKYESDDQIAVARYIGQLPYVDANRIGIWGWSFGGFMSSTCILKAPKMFKAAIAVAPVTNWRYYDNIYTERYMRTPAENPGGYDLNAPEKMAERLQNKFLLIHGTADDNVHFQHAAVLSKELIKANKQFEQAYYPNKNHGISGGTTRLQLYQRMTDFIFREL